MFVTHPVLQSPARGFTVLWPVAVSRILVLVAYPVLQSPAVNATFLWPAAVSQFLVFVTHLVLQSPAGSVTFLWLAAVSSFFVRGLSSITVSRPHRQSGRLADHSGLIRRAETRGSGYALVALSRVMQRPL